MKSIFKLTLLIGLILTMNSCKDDPIVITPEPEPETKTKFEEGVYIINEGWFGKIDGTINFYNPDSSKVYAEVYQSLNPGNTFGDVVQSINIIKEKIYAVGNNSGKITIADAKTIAYEHEITGFVQPRYIIEGANDNLYVSQWGEFGAAGEIKVIDRTSNTITSSIIIGGGPEHMLLQDNNLYIAKSGGWGLDSVVVIVNTTTNDISNTIEVGYNPLDILADKNEELWVLCSGISYWDHPEDNIPGKLVKLVNNEVVLSIDVPTGAHDLAFNQAKDVMYFITNGGLMKHSITNSALDNTITFSHEDVFSFHSMDIDPSTGSIFLGDAKDYQSNGTVYVLNPNHQLTVTFDAGIVPGSYYFTK